jgi:hypothetical protein
MKKWLFPITVVALATAATLMSGCTEDSSDSGSSTPTVVINDSSLTTIAIGMGGDSGSYIGSITGRVGSAADGTLLSGVTIIVTGDHEGDSGASRSVTTDVNGYYQFQNLVLGDYLLTVKNTATHSGVLTHAHVAVPAGHPAIGANSEVRVNVERDIELLPLSASLSGTVYVEKDKILAKSSVAASANRFPAAGAVVQVYIANQIPDRYLDTTNTQGKYSLSKLPATALRNVDAQVTVLSFSDGDSTLLSQESMLIGLNSGTNAAPAVYMNQMADAFALLQANIQSIAPNSFGLRDTLKLTFSADIDAARLTGITLSNGSSLVPIKISATGATLKIAPQLPLTQETSYTLSLNVFSKDGRSNVQSIGFSTIKGLELLNASYMATDNTLQRIGVNAPIILTFNLPPVIDATETQIFLTQGAVLINTAASISGTTLSITPSSSLLPNKDYELYISDLKSSLVGDAFTLTKTLTTVFASAPTKSAGAISLQDADFKADYNTTSVSVKWNRSEDAVQYNIYVKNNKHPAWLLLEANSSVGDNFSTVQRHSVSLNASQLDMLAAAGNSAIEPFALAASCSLMVVPINESGVEGAAGTRQKFGLSDETSPTIFNTPAYTTKIDAKINNTTTAAADVVFDVEFSEYMNTSISPSFSFVSGGNSTVVFSDWQWTKTEGDMGKNHATFTMTIPATTDLSSKVISISNLRDQSGNNISVKVTILLSAI